MGGGADIGGFEIQSTVVPQLPGDYNGNQTVDAADYVIWRKTLGLQVNRYEGADGNGNNSIDVNDFNVWRSNFGRSLGGASIIAPSVVDEVFSAQPSEMDFPVLGHVVTVAVGRPNSERGDVPAKPRRTRPPMLTLSSSSHSLRLKLSPRLKPRMFLRRHQPPTKLTTTRLKAG